MYHRSIFDDEELCGGESTRYFRNGGSPETTRTNSKIVAMRIVEERLTARSIALIDTDNQTISIEDPLPALEAAETQLVLRSRCEGPEPGEKSEARLRQLRAQWRGGVGGLLGGVGGGGT
ncbi:hypothetical protein KM043_006314 [Ampulex compressa]|nr:hypothetical protein KM043_006314 [Ampulex compressa]